MDKTVLSVEIIERWDRERKYYSLIRNDITGDIIKPSFVKMAEKILEEKESIIMSRS